MSVRRGLRLRAVLPVTSRELHRLEQRD